MGPAGSDHLLPGAADLEEARSWLRDPDRILIAAGAGLSAAAGFDYADEDRFAELFPALHRAGFRRRYELIGYPLPPRHQWGFWAVHATDIRFGTEPSPLYLDLRRLVGDRTPFVLTSNVDQLFVRNGFDAEAIYTPQGDYGLAQCLVPCTREVWSSKELLQTALANLDSTTGETTEDAVPACPKCGGPVSLNVFAGSWYINDHFQPGRARLVQWLDDAVAKRDRLLIIELGAGFNTPGVVRWPMEQLVQADPAARLIRINPDFSGVPAEIIEQSCSLSVGAREGIELLGAFSGG